MTPRKAFVSALALFTAMLIAGEALAYQKTINGKLYECTKEETNTTCTYDRSGKLIGCGSATIERCTPVPDKPATLEPGTNPGPRVPKAHGMFSQQGALSFAD